MPKTQNKHHLDLRIRAPLPSPPYIQIGPSFTTSRRDPTQAEAARAARAEQVALFEAGAAKKRQYVLEGAVAAEMRLADMASARAKLVAEEGKLKAATKVKCGHVCGGRID